MAAERERLRQWLQGKIEAGKAAEEARYITLEELAGRLEFDVVYLYALHHETALLRLIIMPDGRGHVRRDEVLNLLRRNATRSGLPSSLDQPFHRPEHLAGEIAIPLGDFLVLIQQGEVGVVRIDTFLRMPEEEMKRLVREIEQGYSLVILQPVQEGARVVPFFLVRTVGPAEARSKQPDEDTDHVCPQEKAQGDLHLAVDEKKKGHGEEGNHHGAAPDPDCRV